MGKKLKLKLEDIKVESFITSLDESKSNKIKGMGCTDTLTNATVGCPTAWQYCCSDRTTVIVNCNAC